MKTTITKFNGNISTQGIIRENGYGYSASIVQNYTNGEVDFLQGKDFKSLNGAQRYIKQYRDKKYAAYKNGELVNGVIVL